MSQREGNEVIETETITFEELKRLLVGAKDRAKILERATSTSKRKPTQKSRFAAGVKLGLSYVLMAIEGDPSHLKVVFGSLAPTEGCQTFCPNCASELGLHIDDKTCCPACFTVIQRIKTDDGYEVRCTHDHEQINMY